MRELIQEAFDNRELLESEEHRAAVFEAIAALDRGELRVAEKRDGGWASNAWVMQAINLYFVLAEMKTFEVGPFEFHDKIPIKRNLAKAGVRVVPPGTIRYGAFAEPGVVLMPGYINIGAWVGSGTMVDTWATVGSGAQIGRNVHLSGGVGIVAGTRTREFPAGSYQLQAALIIGKRRPSTDRKTSLNEALRQFGVSV